MGEFFLRHGDLNTTIPIYDNLVGTEPLRAKERQILERKRCSLARKLIPLKAQGWKGELNK